MSRSTAERAFPPGIRRTLAGVMIAATLLGGVAGCAARRVPAAQGLWEGNASWYGVDYHGRRAADGSRYNMYELTAAHPSLAFGTRVRVTNLGNGRKVVVTVTDRGPFVEGRIIDVSFAAAQQLDMLDDGVTVVRLEVVD